MGSPGRVGWGAQVGRDGEPSQTWALLSQRSHLTLAPQMLSALERELLTHQAPTSVNLVSLGPIWI